MKFFDHYQNQSQSEVFTAISGIVGDVYADQILNVVDIVNIIRFSNENKIHLKQNHHPSKFIRIYKHPLT